MFKLQFLPKHLHSLLQADLNHFRSMPSMTHGPAEFLDLSGCLLSGEARDSVPKPFDRGSIRIITDTIYPWPKFHALRIFKYPHLNPVPASESRTAYSFHKSGKERQIDRSAATSIETLDLKERASTARKRKKYEVAVHLYRQLLEKETSELGEPSAHNVFNLGLTFFEMNRFEEAKEHFLWADRLEPHARTKCQLGITLRELQDLEGSKRYLREAIAIDGQKGRYHCELGITLRELGFLKDSEKSLRRAIELDPKQTRCFCELGITLREMGHEEDSKISLLKAIEMDNRRNNHTGRYHCELGITLRELGLLDDSEKSLRKAIELDPKQPRCFCEHGITLRELNRLKESKAQFLRAILLDGNRPRYQTELGITLRELGQLVESEKALRQAIAIDPKQPRSYIETGSTLSEMEKYEEASRMFQVGLSMNSDGSDLYPDAIVKFAQMRRKQGKWIAAETLLAPLIKQLEESSIFYPLAYLEMIFVKIMIGKKDESLSLMNNAFSKGTTSSSLLSLQQVLERVSEGKSQNRSVQKIIDDEIQKQRLILRGLSSRKSKARGIIWRGRIIDPNRH